MVLVVLELKISLPCKPELHHRRRRWITTCLGNAGGLGGLWAAQHGRKAMLPVLNLPPSAPSATAIAGISSTMWKILRKIIAEALRKTALFLIYYLEKEELKSNHLSGSNEGGGLRCSVQGPEVPGQAFQQRGLAQLGSWAEFPAVFLPPSLASQGHLQQAPEPLWPSTLAARGASAFGQRSSPAWGKLQSTWTLKLVAGRETSFLTGPVQPFVPSHQKVN